MVKYGDSTKRSVSLVILISDGFYIVFSFFTRFGKTFAVTGVGKAEDNTELEGFEVIYHPT